MQEALLAAATQWGRAGRPRDPKAWLVRVAARRLVDQLRSDDARRRREHAVAVREPIDQLVAPAADWPVASAGQDDTLLLLLLVLCCHPALTPASQIALTLRAVGGLSTAEIARAFLVPEATIAQRISRAKRRIADSGVGFPRPSSDERDRRLQAVLHVLYLSFNEGYTASGGATLQRTELADEAIRLTRTLRQTLPGDGRVSGLLALMLLTDARRAARTGPAGELVPLTEQDRSRWDGDRIREGLALTAAALAAPPIGAYQVQAAIAAVHDEAARAEDTDWAQILALYRVLERLEDNPMVRLSRIVAEAMVHGPRVGLARLALLDTDARLAGHHRLAAVRAHLLELADEPGAAAGHYRTAAARAASLPERRYLQGRAARLQAGAAPPDGLTFPCC